MSDSSPNTATTANNPASTASDLVQYSTHGRVAVLTINNPPVNVLSPGVPEGVLAGLARGNADDAVAAFVLIGGGRSFIAGADIRTFTMSREEAPDVRGLVAGLEASDKPVVAAMHGSALGGGLEAALGCRYRVASPGTRLGQPEVKLGLLPGAGGTQRLPRLVGLEAALGMIVKGDPVTAEEALGLGLVDELIEGDLLEGALAYAEGIVGETRPRTSELTVESAAPLEAVFTYARAETQKRAGGMIAPLRCIDAVEAAATLSWDEGLARERELFEELLNSDQSKALRHIFFAEREAAKVPGLEGVKPKAVTRAAVVGAGTMGGGIAMNFANAGIPVKVLETSEENLTRGMSTVRKNYQRTVDKGRLTQEEMDERVGRIEGVLEYEALGDVDLVVEAVFEDMNIKKEVFGTLNKVTPADAILATNTSTLDVNEIAAVVSHPDKVLGTHFFSPANVMKLVEVVRADETSAEALATALALAKAMRKTPVVVGVCDGFVGNRMVHVYVREAFFLVEEGALPQQVDGVMQNFGLAMGPFAMGDLAGLDVGYRIRQAQTPTRRPEERYSSLADKVVEAGRLGQKTGAGFYRYEGSRTPLPDPEIDALVLAHSEEAGFTRRAISDEEILKRLMYALVNEGAKILEEGIAARAGDIDVIYVYGYGFPAYRGGPMFYADTVGLKEVYADVERFYKEFGDHWKPAPLLKKLAEEGGTFNGWQGENA